MFEDFIEKENDTCGYTMTYTIHTFKVDVITKHFKSLEKAIEKAKEVQNEFCEEYEFSDIFPHDYGDVVDGKTYCSIFNEINGCGIFVTEDEFSDFLLIKIEKIVFEE